MVIIKLVKKKKWIAAINRLKFVITKYDTSIYVEEALHRFCLLYTSDAADE